MSTCELAWFKSSYSGSDGDSCIEVAVSRIVGEDADTVLVRDSKLRRSPRFTVSDASWQAFVAFARQD
jgi:hypothetical protein